MKRLAKYIISGLLITISISISAQPSEMINNGTFDDASNWSTNSYFYISGSAAHFDNLGIGALTQSAANLVSPIENNSTYVLSFDLTIAAEGGRAYFRIYDDINSNIYAPLTRYREGSHQLVFTTPATNNGGIRFYAYTGEDAFSIDNVSLIKGADPVGSPYFISLTGHDANEGSISSPFATPGRAFRVAEAGDSIYIRAGIYYRTQNQGTMGVSVAGGSINQGASGSPIFFGGYPPDIANGDSVIFDFINVMPEEPDFDGIEATPPTATTRTNNGFSFSWVNHLHLKDFTIRNVLQRYRYVQCRGINFYGCNYLRLERVHVYNIGGQGIFSTNGTIDPTKYKDENGDTIDVVGEPLDPYTLISGTTVWLPGDTTYVIDCDAYRCIDSFAVNVFNYNNGEAGTWAQGFFFVNSFAGEYQEFRNCRTWECADDGTNNHGYGTTWLNNCWSFNNGIYFPYLDHTSSGNGFKVNNVSDTTRVDKIQIHHWVTNSIAAYNVGFGFAENHVAGQPSLNRNNYNNLAYKNWVGFIVTQPDPDGWVHLDNRYINNIAHDHRTANSMESNGAYFETKITNSWDTPPGVAVTDADFLELPTDALHNLAILSAARQADGSLPDIGDYYKLAPNSSLIDAGTDVGLPYIGSDPDLGPFEFGTISVEIISPETDRKVNKGESIILKARAHDTDGSVNKVFFTIEGQDDPLGIAEKKTSDEWEFLWENVSEIGYYSLRAKATNFNNDTATSQRILISIDTIGNEGQKVKSNCRIIYDGFFQNPSLKFFEPLKVDPYLKFHGLDAKTIYQGEFVIKDFTNEIKIDLSLFRPHELYIVEVTNVEGCLPQLFIAQ